MPIGALLKFVVTNDDGYDQPGLAALVQAASTLGDVRIVAPATPQSNVGHRVTLREPMRVDRRANGTMVVHATPADCTRLAIKEFEPGLDWILAGINLGANLGSDVYQSGTVAAAREAAILGIPAVAVSQYIAAGQTANWPAAVQHTARCLAALLDMPLGPGQYWNINLPSPIIEAQTLDFQLCPLDTNAHRYQYNRKDGAYHYKGRIHDRPRTTGSDVDICFGGKISATRLEV